MILQKTLEPIQPPSVGHTLHEKHPYSELFKSIFPVFRLNTINYSVKFRIQSEFRKIWTKKVSLMVSEHKFKICKLPFVVQSLLHSGQRIRQSLSHVLNISTFYIGNKLYKESISVYV